MEKSKEELEKAYLEIKFLISQLGDDVPPDVRELIDRNLLKTHKALYVMLPACENLAIELKELTYTKYPEFKDNRIPHMDELVWRICVELANSIAKNADAFLIDLEKNNTPYIENEEQLQKLVAFFATPLDELEESENQSPEDKAKAESQRTINNDKKEFLNVILKVLFRYFEEPLNNLDAKGWQLIGISLGYTFMVYLKRCYMLMAGLTEGILTENPGISYEDLEKKLCPDITTSMGNDWLQYL